MKGDCKFVDILRYHYDKHITGIPSVELLIEIFKIDYEFAENSGKTKDDVVREWFGERE